MQKSTTARLGLEVLEDRQMPSASPLIVAVECGPHGTAFGLDAQSRLYQNVNGQGWTYLNAFAKSFSVGTDTAGRDEAYFLGKDDRLYRCDQGVSAWTGGGLNPGFRAGHGEVFGFSADHQLYCYKEGTGWANLDGKGSYCDVGTDAAGRDEVFMLGIDNIVWRYDQGWTSTRVRCRAGSSAGRAGRTASTSTASSASTTTGSAGRAPARRTTAST